MAAPSVALQTPQAFDGKLQTAQPGSFGIVKDPEWGRFTDPKNFAWQALRPKTQTLLALKTEPRTATCVVPLLSAPVNPNVDRNMPEVKTPSASQDGVVTGLPPCRDGKVK